MKYLLHYSLAVLCVVALAGCPLAGQRQEAKYPAPDVVGMHYYLADAVLRSQGYSVALQSTTTDDTVESDSIVSQNPPPGTLVTAGSIIEIVVSIGRPLAIDSFEPTGASIEIDELVHVEFSHSLRRSSITPATFRVETASGARLPGTFAGARSTIIFRPTSDLPSNTEIRVTATTGIEDTRGESLETDFSWSFMTGPDTVAPSLLDSSPSASEADVHTTIRALFDEPIAPETVDEASFYLVRGTGGDERVPGIIETIGNEIVFTPDEPLLPLQAYTVFVNDTITDLHGNGISPTIWGFKTHGIDQRFSFPFPIKEAVFDPVRDSIYFSREDTSTIHAFDLAQGKVTQVYAMAGKPTAMEIEPDGSILHVVLETSSDSGDSPGLLVEIPLNGPPQTTLIDLEVDPIDVETIGDGTVYVSGRYDRGIRIDSYDIASGTPIAKSIRIDEFALTAIPFTPWLYAFDRSEFSKFRMENGTLTRVIETNRDGGGTQIWAAPAGDWAVSSRGQVLAFSTDHQMDLEYFGTLVDGDVTSVHFSKNLGAVFLAQEERIQITDSESFRYLDQIPFGASETTFLGMNQSETRLVAVTSEGGSSEIATYHHRIARQNERPTALLTSSHTEVDTWGAVQLDATGSLDGEILATDLQYAWDWDSDGVVDTDLQDTPQIYHSFSEPGPTTVTLTVVDGHGHSDDATVDVDVSGIAWEPHLPNSIDALVPSSDPEIVFAIDSDLGELYAINTVSKRIVYGVPTPSNRPLGIEYVEAEDKLYINYHVSSIVDVYDVPARRFSRSYSVSPNAALDFAVAPTRRRLYATSGQELIAIDLDTGDVVGVSDDTDDIYADNAIRIVLDEANGWLYTYGGFKDVRQFDITNDEFILESHVDRWSFCGDFLLSPDGLRIVPFCENVGPGPGIYAFSTDDLVSIAGVWLVEAGALGAVFSPNDDFFVVAPNQSPNVLVLGAHDYQYVTHYDFPTGRSTGVLQMNADGSVIIAVGHRSPSAPEGLYFFPAP